MKISAEIIADSTNWTGKRLTTFKLTFPRIILAELNTHRAFSRNSASSRAIPFEKMVQSVQEDPFIPIAWQKGHKGMQGIEYLIGTLSDSCESDWLKARDNAILMAKSINFQGATKQLCNRLLEPFMWHTVILTSEEEGLENFFNLRCPIYEDWYWNDDGSQDYIIRRSKKDYLSNTPYKENTFLILPNGKQIEILKASNLDWLQINKGQAEIHMMALAEAMWDTYNESKPKFLKEGEWHIPFESDINSTSMWDAMEDAALLGLRKLPVRPSDIKCQIAVAKCARVSYTTVGEKDSTDYLKDLKLFDRLLESRHLSPFEHIAKVPDFSELNYLSEGWYFDTDKGKEIFIPGQLYSNFNGWIQYRKIVENIIP